MTDDEKNEREKVGILDNLKLKEIGIGVKKKGT